MDISGQGLILRRVINPNAHLPKLFLFCECDTTVCRCQLRARYSFIYGRPVYTRRQTSPPPGPNRRAHTAVGRLMMEKLSGRVAYAVMSFESFLGMGGGARHSMEQIDL